MIFQINLDTYMIPIKCLLHYKMLWRQYGGGGTPIFEGTLCKVLRPGKGGLPYSKVHYVRF